MSETVLYRLKTYYPQHPVCIDAAQEIEALQKEIVRLLECREREADRLDWLLARIRGDEIRRPVGEMNHTGDVVEWR